MSRSELPVVIVAAGSHSRVIAGALAASGRTIIGFLDDAHPSGTSIDGVPVLGGDEVLARYPPQTIEVALGIGSLPKRRQMFERLCAHGYRVAQIIHPSCVVTGPVTLGAGSQLHAGVVVQPGSTIGDNVLVNTRASVDHECVLEAHAIVSPGAVLCGNVTVGEAATIGPGATVVRGRRIGAGAIVAAGAVVVEDVPPGITVFGVPARVRPV